MMLHIPNLIEKNQLQIMRQAMESASFIDGKLSAGKTAKKIKHNEELEYNNEIAQNLGRIMIGHLYSHEPFRQAAMPYRIAAPLFARYKPGMHYGAHIDDPVMGGDGQRFRCDIAVTLFINNPDEYQGGELCIKTAFGTQKAKHAAGDIILYPASSLHYVDSIDSGERLVGIVWVQSMVRDPAQREILYDLVQARDQLSGSEQHQKAYEQVDHSYTNLVRRWAEV